MLYTIAVVLFVLWLLGVLGVFHIALTGAGMLIHLLLVIAIVLVVFNLLSGRGARV